MFAMMIELWRTPSLCRCKLHETITTTENLTDWWPFQPEDKHKDCFTMGEKLEILYNAMKEICFLKVYDTGIELFRNNGHPAFANRIIPAFQDMLSTKIEANQ